MTFDDTDYKNKISAIRKYYKNDKKFLEVYFDNYNSFHIYIRDCVDIGDFSWY